MQRRAAILCQVGDALALTRPRGWADRSRRAYLGAIRRLDWPALAAAASPDPAAVAHAALREARRPYRRLAAVLARVGALGFVGLATLALVASRPRQRRAPGCSRRSRRRRIVDREQRLLRRRGVGKVHALGRLGFSCTRSCRIARRS